jgi:hypothetical protein
MFEEPCVADAVTGAILLVAAARFWLIPDIGLGGQHKAVCLSELDAF